MEVEKFLSQKHVYHARLSLHCLTSRLAASSLPAFFCYVCACNIIICVYVYNAVNKHPGPVTYLHLTGETAIKIAVKIPNAYLCVLSVFCSKMT